MEAQNVASIIIQKQKRAAWIDPLLLFCYTEGDFIYNKDPLLLLVSIASNLIC